MSAMSCGSRFDMGEDVLNLTRELRSELRLHHLDVSGKTLQVCLEVVLAARLGSEPVLLHVGKDRAEAAPLLARNGEVLVDDDSGDALLARLPEDAPLLRVL